MNAQKGARSVSVVGEQAVLPVRHVVDRRWLPKDLWDRYWTPITDTSVVVQGDKLYNPERYQQYAGTVTQVAEHHVDVLWDVDQVVTTYARNELNRFWRMTEA